MQDDLTGFGRLAPTEQLYWMALCEVRDKGVMKSEEVENDLLRRGHLEEYGEVLKLTESGFQLLAFLRNKMSGTTPLVSA